ncbi:MAG: kinase-like domain-containing protein [Monoraphidium minutum]|nr:MAG: kinase-like domain-containing protein [Monoraphidium minutum]
MSSLPQPYKAGDVLGGRYEVQGEINRGATAVVYAACDGQSGLRVALKVVACGGPKQVPISVVRREVTLSSSVAHEHLVQLLDVFAQGDAQLVIVWELVEGLDLLELLNSQGGRMPEPMAAFYFVQLLRAVLHVHEAGFCHRDIKPENCMVEGRTHKLKLIDFGLAKHLESVKTLGVGTPDYMPPEMLVRGTSAARPQPSGGGGGGEAGGGVREPPPYDAAAVDAWACGVLLYLLISGVYPFEDPGSSSLSRTIQNVLRGTRRPLPPGVSPECAARIDGLLQRDPSRRARLHDLAYDPWLLHQAQIHALQIGLITPAQLLAAGGAAAAAQAAAAAHVQAAAAAAAHAQQAAAAQAAAWQQQQQPPAGGAAIH